ncbi:MAG: hypothetical protein JNL28_16425 [Planctomycetes bacterium]|nr:hypothetical protein [Planctomycetota bacterium]
MSSSATKRPIRRARLALLAAAVLLPLIAWFGLQWRGATLRRAAIDRIAIDHQALLPAFLPSPPRTDRKHPDEWLLRVARTRPAWDLSDLSDPPKYARFLEDARANRLGEEARVAFEDFEVKFRPYLEAGPDQDQRWNEFWVGLAVRFRDCDGTSDWGDATQAAVRLLAVGLADCLRVARLAHEYAPIDPVSSAAALERTNESFPKLPFVEEARLGDAIHVTAIHKAQSRYTVEALEALRTGLELARIHSPSHWLLSEMMWSLQMMRVLDGLQTILPMLPRGIDLAGLENELTAARPRESMANAIRGERAFGNRVLELMRRGDVPRDGEIYAPSNLLSRLHRALVEDFDQACYLDTLTDLALRAEKSPYLRPAAADGVPDTFWTPTASIVAPSLGPSLHSTDLLEARLALARVALTAYRKDAKEALTFLATTFDPFDGRQLRCAFGDDGLIVFWSVGPDGKDDAAARESDDIVWGLKLSE